MALLVWQQIVFGVMVPLLFEAVTHRAYLLPPHAAQPAPRAPVSWRRVLAMVQRLWRSIDTALTELCTGVGYDGPQLALAAWLLLGNVWLLCSAAAARAVPLADPA